MIRHLSDRMEHSFDEDEQQILDDFDDGLIDEKEKNRLLKELISEYKSILKEEQFRRRDEEESYYD